MPNSDCKNKRCEPQDEDNKYLLKNMNFILKFIEIIYAKTDYMTFYVSYNNIKIDLFSFYVWVCKVYIVFSDISAIYDKYCEVKNFIN